MAASEATIPKKQYRYDQFISVRELILQPPIPNTATPTTNCQLAPIESLPTEITQNIFFLAMDLRMLAQYDSTRSRYWVGNFPQASLHISEKLDDPYIYTQLCDWVFGYTNLPQRAKPLSLSDHQTRLFSMRWMTWRFFKAYLAKRVPPKPCGCPIYVDCDEEGGCHGLGGTPAYDSKRREVSIFLPKIHCALPRKLTQGPWTKDKVKFLRCLLKISSMSVDWADQDSVRTAIQGKRDAIMERNLDAVHLFSRVRRLSRAPNLALVRFAVLEAGCERSIVLSLMMAAREWGHRRWNDPELDAWVAREEAKRNPKGMWLRIKLEELRYGKLLDLTAGDYRGDDRGDVLEVRIAPFRVRYDGLSGLRYACYHLPSLSRLNAEDCPIRLA